MKRQLSDISLQDINKIIPFHSLKQIHGRMMIIIPSPAHCVWDETSIKPQTPYSSFKTGISVWINSEAQ